MTHHHLIIIQARGWSTAQDQRAACLALDTTSPDLASWLLFITTLSPCSDATSLHCTTHFLFPFSQLLLKRGFMFLFKLVLVTWFILLPPKKKTSGNRQPKPHSLVCCSQLTVKREKKASQATPTSPKRQNKTKRNRNKKKFKEDSEPVCHALRKREQDLGRQTTGSKAHRQRQRQSRTDTTRNTNAQFGRVR